MTYPSELTAQLYDTDASTLISGALDDAFGISFMDELNGVGYGQISIALTDSDADQVLSGRFVRIITNNNPCFTFKIEGHPEYHQIDRGEEVEQFITASGRGWGCVLDEAVTQPEPLLVGVDLDTSWRLWSFASINFPNTSGWGAAQELYEYLDGVSYGVRVDAVKDPGDDPDDPGDDVTKLYPAPIGFPWPNAPKNGNGFAPTAAYDPMYWVIADGASEPDIGTHFFRSTFTLAGDQQITFHGTGDNLWTMFLDGVPILGEDDDMVAWLWWKEVSLTLPAGTHTLAFACENVAADIPYNPGGALFDAIAIAVYPGDIETTLTLSLITSTAADLTESYFSADDWPGWTPGQIINDWINEVQDRGAVVPYTGDSFTATQDTNGDDWSSKDVDTEGPYIPVFALRVGATGLDLLNELQRLGWLHWHFQPDVLMLDGWAGISAIGTNVGVSFTEGVNIVGLERGQTKPYANAILVQWAKGNVWVQDNAAITAYGSRVEDLLATDAATTADAQRLGRVELQRRVVDATAAVAITIEPQDTGHAPYEGFGIGDYVSVPDIDGDPFTVQVLSISAQQDDEGNAVWRLECNNRWRSPAQEGTDLLRSIGGKSFGSVAQHGVPKD